MEWYMDKFEIDPLIKYEEFIFEDGTDEILSYIREAQEGATKQNIIQKLLTALKKLAEWIAKKARQFVSFIKGLFTKKSTADVNTILDEELGAPKNNAAEVSPKKSPKIKSVTTKKDGTTKTQVEIKSVDKNGKVVNIQEVISSIQGMSVRLKDSKIHVMFSGRRTYRANDTSSANASREFVAKQESANVEGTVAGLRVVMGMAKNANIRKYMEEVVNDIKLWSKDTNDNPQLNKRLQTNSKLLYDRLGDTSLEFNGIMTMDEFNAINNIMTKLAEAISSVVPSADKMNANSTIVEVLNRMNMILIRCQFGMNKIGSAVNGRYDPDPGHIGMVKDLAKLDKCVKQMIVGGIPAKFVARNAYLLADESICKYSDINNPRFGQGRVTLYGSDKSICTKVAITPLGIQDNATDKYKYGLIAKNGGKDLVTKVIRVEKNNCIEVAEYAEPVENKAYDLKDKFRSSSRYYDDRTKLYRDLNMLSAKGIDIGDSHEGNLGYVGKRLVLLDYGQTSNKIKYQ